MQRLEDTTKTASVTAGLQPFHRKMLENIPPDNANTICDHILAEITENNIKDSTKAWKIKVLVYLSRFLNHKSFKDVTKEDVLAYLNTLRKPEEEDEMHRWIGTYNNRTLVFTNFFRWLYNPDEPDRKKRITPPCIKGVRQLKRKEISAYKPSDLWIPAEHDLFLRYCPQKRDKCYHAMARDTSARPHELLKLKIGDIQVKIEPSTGRQYAEIVVSGKTKTRTLPLIDSLPYVKEWLAQHPESGNPKAPLFISQSDRCAGSRLTVDGLGFHFRYYKTKYFPALLTREGVPEEDKKVIRGMLQKPWNPYVFRHSALTEKAQILTESNLRNHSGWTATSKMPAVYLHFFGTESSKALLEANGIISKDRQESNILHSKVCPNCNEPNTAYTKFCSKCGFILTYDAYSEAQTKAIQDLVNELGAEQMNAEYEREKMMETIEALKKQVHEISRKVGN